MRIDRRTLLRGTGATLALPMLEAMRPSVLSAAGSGETSGGALPVRSAFIFFPNGAIMDRWKPAKYGTQHRLSESLSSLARFKEDLLFTSGLAQDPGRSHGDGAGDHARNSSTFLTCAHPKKTAGADIRVGISVDQVIAAAVGEQTRLPSLELGIQPSRHSGRCDSGYSCAYQSNISWKSETLPTSKEIHPRFVFERMFGGAAGDAEARKRRRFYRQSILDFVADDAAKLKKRVGVKDRHKLDEYYQSVREVEQRIDRAAQNEKPIELPPGTRKPGRTPSDVGEHMRLMYDLMTLAFRTDTTRVATFMLGNGSANWSFPDLGVTEGHHQLSHHRNDENKMERLARIDRFLAEQFAYFVKSLKDVSEGDGTLLDQCQIVFGSGISDANRHDHGDLPVIVAGRAGGAIKTGRHLNYGKSKKGEGRGSSRLSKLQNGETPMANLYLSMIRNAGVEAKRFGDSSGVLPALSS